MSPSVAAEAISNSAGSQILLKVDTPRRLFPQQEVAITGWALASEPIRNIIVKIGGNTKFAHFGLYRHDLAVAFPERKEVASSGFICTFQAEDSAAGTMIEVTAQTRSGKEHTAEVPLPTESTPDPAELGSGVPQSPRSAHAAMELNVDQATIDRAGLLRIGGWVVAHSSVETVEIRVNEELIGTAQYGLEREDVARAWPSYGNAANSGFRLVTDGSGFPDAIEVTVRARAFGGIFRETTIPVRRKVPAQSRPVKEQHELTFDEALLTTAGKLHLAGWAVSSAGIAEIRVVFEGEVVGRADYGRERPDVGNKFPRLPQSRQSGFAFAGAVEPGRLRAEHVLSLDVELAGGDVKRFNVAVAPTAAETEPSAAAEAGAPDVLFHIDEPEIAHGAVAQVVKGNLQIGGWAVSRDGIEDIEVELQGAAVGKAFHGMPRKDVSQALPDIPGALRSGFGFSLPRRAMSEGTQTVALRFRTRNGSERRIGFTITVAGGEEQEGPWSLRRKMPAAERLVADKLIEKLPPTIFEIWLNATDAAAASLRATLESLEQQVWPNWRVRIHGNDAGRAEVTALVEAEFASLAEQIILTSETVKQKGAKREADLWVMPIEAGDLLSCDALMEFAIHAATHGEANFVYADERRPNPASQRMEAFFKPAWSPDLLMSTNYIGRPWCAQASVLRNAKISIEGSQYRGQYDSVLRCTERGKGIVRIPKVLGERGPVAEPLRSEVQALARANQRRKYDAAVKPGRIAHTYRVERKRAPEGLVSIIIPTCAARGLIKTCLESIRALSTYKDIEIICVDNILDEQSEWKPWLRENCDVVVEILEPFNWSRFNNIAAEEAAGSYLLFLNDDIEVVQSAWLEVLMEQASRPEVGVVGPQLLYPDRKVQHAGQFLVGGGLARHAFRFCDENDPGYFGLALTQRNVIAVTGACLLVRKEVFQQVGGFEEAHAIVNNDLDFCLKAGAAGYWNIYSPFATLIHHELASRHSLKDVHDVESFENRWSSVAASGDPFFHPNLIEKS